MFSLYTVIVASVLKPIEPDTGTFQLDYERYIYLLDERRENFFFCTFLRLTNLSFVMMRGNHLAEFAPFTKFLQNPLLQ